MIAIYQSISIRLKLNYEISNVICRLFGKGGAIRLQRGIMTIENSRFINNSASLRGGSLYVDKEGTATLNGTYMDNSIHLKTGMDDIVHSKGIMVITKGEFHVKAIGMKMSFLSVRTKVQEKHTHYV